MALATLTISCILFYMTSKYFPVSKIEVVRKNTIKTLFVASAVLILSLYLFSIEFSFITAFVVWLIAFMTLMSLIVLSIKMNDKWIWGGSLFSISSLIIDLF